MKRSPLPKRRSYIKRRVRVKPRNEKRHAANWTRAYHSVERVQFVKDLPCANCGYQAKGGCDNAHTENAGMSRKGHFSTIIPLCHERWEGKIFRMGCHARYDLHELPHLEMRTVELRTMTEIAWQRHFGVLT